MPAATRKVSRTPRTPEKSAPRARGWKQRLQEFLENKAMIEQLTARNQGEGRGEDKTPGLRDDLLAHVIAHGERDPETGSFVLELDEPVTVGITKAVIRKLKAERRAPKSLDLDKALEWAEKNEVRDRIEEFVYTLRLTSAQAEEFSKLLTKAKLVDRVQSTDAVVVEENLLQLHYGRDPHTAAPLAEEILDEETLDSLYTVNESFAFKPLTR